MAAGTQGLVGTGNMIRRGESEAQEALEEDRTIAYEVKWDLGDACVMDMVAQ